MKYVIIGIFVTVFVSEFLFRPRLDKTEDGILLWYGIKTRKFIKL